MMFLLEYNKPRMASLWSCRGIKEDLMWQSAHSTDSETHLISLAISSSVSPLLLSMNMRNSTMATSPTTDPRVAAVITPALEAEKRNKDGVVISQTNL